MQICIDIETIPSQQPGARDHIVGQIRPPGTLKKPESIEAWWLNESAAAVEAEYRKQSLDGGLFGEIISIAVVAADDDTDPGWSYCREPGEAETLVLSLFADAVTERINREAAKNAGGEYNWASDPYFICHNAAFDLPFVWHRCLVNGVRLPFKFPRPSAREGKDYGCTMVQWAGYGGRVSLDALCRALRVESPKDGGIDGAGVFDAWQAGECERIRQYNLRDAVATREIWHRLQGGGAQ